MDAGDFALAGWVRLLRFGVFAHDTSAPRRPDTFGSADDTV
jgi:hypothetical protein